VRHHSTSVAPNQLPKLAGLDGPSPGVETRSASVATGPRLPNLALWQIANSRIIRGRPAYGAEVGRGFAPAPQDLALWCLSRWGVL
jgi:hypothetical protein